MNNRELLELAANAGKYWRELAADMSTQSTQTDNVSK